MGQVDEFRLDIYGKPVPWSRPEDNKYGGRRNKPAHEAQLKLIRQYWQMAGCPQVGDGPLTMGTIFYFKRPKSHYGTGRNSDKLKPSAPQEHIYVPDLSNLEKLVEDALSKGYAFHDDKQIVGRSPDSFKAWGPNAGTIVVVRKYG